MNLLHWTSRVTLIVIVGALAGYTSASTNDRFYQLGEDPPVGPAENASNGAPVASGNSFGTLDSVGQTGMDQLPPLTPKGITLPVYRTITGRPDGGTGLGIEFNGAQQQYVHGQSLNWPQESLSAVGGNFIGTINYDGIDDRGMQFWVKPGSAVGPQSIVMDSNQHGVRINASGNFSMRYDGRDTDSGLTVTPGSWYHIMVVRPNGPASGSRMFIDGVAVAIDNLSDYASDSSNLVLGANTGGDDGFGDSPVGFTGGTAEFFTGIIDDLSMFVIGDNSSNEGPPAGQNWGAFDFATENAYAAFALTGVAGDIDNNGVLEPDDVSDFIDGWRYEKRVNGVRIGDLESYSKGDLNLDGITNIFDLNMMQAALRDQGMAAITAAQLAGGITVPEPSTLALLLAVVSGAYLQQSRHRRSTQDSPYYNAK